MIILLKVIYSYFSNNRQALAEWLAEGCIQDFKK